MARIYEALSGHRIEYADPDPKVEKFLKRALAMLDDREATPSDLVALIYGSENPILGTGPIPGTGQVTKAVIENPVYHVLADIIFRKQVAQSHGNVERIASRFTLSATDAAKYKGVSVDAIRAAARERRIPSWVKDGAYFFEPKALDAIQLGTRGPLPKSIEPLEYCWGYDTEKRSEFKMKAVGLPDPKLLGTTVSGGTSNKGTLERWRTVGVLTGGGGKLRFFEIEPSSEENEIAFGGFYVRGKFSFVRKVNNPKEARKAWEAFVAS